MNTLHFKAYDYPIQIYYEQISNHLQTNLPKEWGGET